MSDDPYVYPGTSVLKNKFNIRDQEELARAERVAVQARMEQGVPRGDFDLAHLRAIHRHLFQDVYDWAGEVRTLEISKGGSHFQPHRYVDQGMADVHRRIIEAGYLEGMEKAEFANEAGRIIGDINYVHPFREGNGRTQLHYLKQLAERAGHEIDLTKLRREQWLEASRQAQQTDYDPMARSIEASFIEPGQEKEADPRLD